MPWRIVDNELVFTEEKQSQQEEERICYWLEEKARKLLAQDRFMGYND